MKAKGFYRTVMDEASPIDLAEARRGTAARMKRGIVGALIIAGLVGGGLALQGRAAAQEGAEQGRLEFMSQGCHGCHTVQGLKMGTPIGPDLSHVGVKYSESYLRKWLRDPARQRPAAHMPMLELTEPQIFALGAIIWSRPEVIHGSCSSHTPGWMTTSSPISTPLTPSPMA